ncbi:hypothetical protein BST81_22345 [Leptolyngbya sp. 'hensonii']|uniref:DUF928 domain-containing protein n=1 Tax=Leptolyngbya sp. 'hensonii' TaxID=1922337 RepID=UPI000960DDD2|nr:DUF928 domain-containing protein [Leptolyngbya sp. 'hensonii']OLP16146.1 hypothetical protein BST81_22345 [Leptolyngbya sp. 'hensonii']
MTPLLRCTLLLVTLLAVPICVIEQSVAGLSPEVPRPRQINPIALGNTDSLGSGNRLKCGYVKDMKYAPPPTKAPDGANRVAVEEPLNRCGGARTVDGRFAVAILPSSGFSQTLAEYPTFLIYMPFTSVQEGIFSLSTSPNSYPYYQARAQLTGNRGIIRFQLPSSAPNLVAGKKYFWQFRFSAVTNESENQLLVIRGQIQRINASATLQNQLAIAAPRQKAAIYANNGIWQDALTTLAQLKCANPGDQGIASDWSSLLQQVELKELAMEPIIGVTVQPDKKITTKKTPNSTGPGPTSCPLYLK